MDFSASTQFNIFDLYRRFCDIKLGSSYPYREGVNMVIDELEKSKFSREAISQLSKMVDSTMNMRVSILDELRKLMLDLNIMEDFSEFSQFYDFVFLVCRENGQKNITVSRAIAAWKLVLAGRFRLLNQWCDFVEKNQRYNISEDTWNQVLAFSRCVHEDLEGYDPEGAWPTLIDDFVEHMYRITGSDVCSSHNLTYNCGDHEGTSFTCEDLLPGLRNLPGLKRKHHVESQRNELEHSCLSQDVINFIINFKRRKQEHQQLPKLVSRPENPPRDVSGETVHISSPSNTSKSPCAVEGCLSKGFAGLFSSPPCARNPEQRVSYT